MSTSSADAGGGGVRPDGVRGSARAAALAELLAMLVLVLSYIWGWQNLFPATAWWWSPFTSPCAT
jgi:hypothetical protein